MFGEAIDQQIIVLLSALAAAMSFIAVALPYINKKEKKLRKKELN